VEKSRGRGKEERASLMDEKTQQLKGSTETPRDGSTAYVKVARQMCREGRHSYQDEQGTYRSPKYLGHDWSPYKLAIQLGIIDPKVSKLAIKHSWCGESECFFCGKTIRILTVNGDRYEFEI